MRTAGALSLCLVAGATAIVVAEGVASAQVAQARAPRSGPARDRERRDREKKEAEARAAEEQRKAEAPAAAPPPAAPPEPEPKPVDDRVEADKAIYFSGDLAVTRADLGAIVDETHFDRTVANGVLYGLSTGLRLKDFRFGVRWRVYDTTEFVLWNLALSAGYALPLRPLTPIISVHAGYVFDQKMEPALFRSALPPGTVLPPDVDVNGLLVGIDVNASYWVTKFLRLGAFIGADLMFLGRSQATAPPSLFGSTAELAHPLYTEGGAAIGLNFNLGLRAAFDIAVQ